MQRVLIALCLSLGIPLVQGGEYQEFMAGGGEINWSRGTVVAEGRGAAPEGGNPKLTGLLACRAAVVDAQRNLLESTQGVRVEAVTLVKDFMLASDEVRSSVEGEVKGATIISRDVDDAGICSVRMQLFLEGNVANRLYSALYDADEAAAAVWPTARELWAVSRALLAHQPTLASAHWVAVPRAYAQPGDDWVKAYESLSERLRTVEERLELGVSTDNPAKEQRPTGLVVDARGSNFIPSLSPNIRQLRGGIVYPDPAAKKSLTGEGRLVALFARDVDFALGHPRVGERPQLVKGLRTWGETRTEIVLGEEAAQTVASLARSEFFTDAGVIIVLD